MNRKFEGFEMRNKKTRVRRGTVHVLHFIAKIKKITLKSSNDVDKHDCINCFEPQNWSACSRADGTNDHRVLLGGFLKLARVLFSRHRWHGTLLFILLWLTPAPTVRIHQLAQANRWTNASHRECRCKLFGINLRTVQMWLRFGNLGQFSTTGLWSICSICIFLNSIKWNAYPHLCCSSTSPSDVDWPSKWSVSKHNFVSGLCEASVFILWPRICCVNGLW